MLSLEMLPGRHGDCLWLEWGDAAHPHRLLIDGGTKGTYGDLRARLRALPAQAREFELLVITHVDADHISGVLELLENKNTQTLFKDIWFNSWTHLLPEGIEEQGPVQGERLTEILEKPTVPWNVKFGGKRIAVPDQGPLPVKGLDGGLTLMLVSPTVEQLALLKPEWEKEVRNAGLDPERPRPKTPPPVPSNIERFGAGDPDVAVLACAPFEEDHSRPNGSSIAVVAEYDGKRLLLAGDAHVAVIAAAIDRLLKGSPDEKLKLDAFKLPHHGSKANISKELLERVDCQRYLVSTSGAYFKHPDYEAMARVIKYGGNRPHLFFNYRTAQNKVWDRPGMKAQYRYEATYPPDGSKGLRIDF